MTKTPKLRFPGFTDAWEQDKVSKLMVRVSEISDTTDIPTIEYEDVVSGSGSLIPGYERKETNKKGIIFQNGDVLFGKLRPYLKNWLLAEFDGKAVGDWWVLHSEKLNSEFQYSLIQNSQFQEVANISTGTKMPRSDWKLVSEVKLFFPTLPEQEAIGTFFRQLDELLTLHQRKLDEVKNLKKSLLQKMFPKNGERIPEVRFPEFTAAWEQRKLGEVVEITMGQSPSSKNYTENPSDYILVQGNADMKNGHVVPRVWTTQITKQAEKGDLILSVRAPVGDIGKTDYDVVIGRGVAAIKGNSFIFQLLTKMKITGYWTRFSTGSTFESINSDNLKNAQIIIPSLKEQEKIGKTFNSINSLISLHQRKLEHLQSLKRALLQQMFI
ncbi:restriction endonuclease subunit S [Streptococcus mutans]|uniref:restriction endonuclease subunit S n=3 Tax=Streptococcus mutans TaxID=1309 RepID=UPI002740AFA3|nr:restriction endonuclease subunit S [Streptococcus mutans]MDP5873839.1 restriction endonuclease subunit S [Streptococcus mutans]